MVLFCFNYLILKVRLGNVVKNNSSSRSAIDMYLTVESIKGVSGEDRIVVKLNGKFLPHIQQLAENDTSKK